jgi:hypothetical protein
VVRGTANGDTQRDMGKKRTARTGLFFIDRELPPVLLLQFFELVVHGQLLLAGQPFPLSFHVGEGYDGGRGRGVARDMDGVGVGCGCEAANRVSERWVERQSLDGLHRAK